LITESKNQPALTNKLKQNKIIKPCSRLSTVRWYLQHHAHRKQKKTLEVVKVHVSAKFHQAKCSSSRVINSALNFGQVYRLRSRISLEWISNRQAENGVSKHDFFHVR